MIGLLSFVVRAVLLAGFTFGFVVLYEHGPNGFAAGAPVELEHFKAFLITLKNRSAEASSPAPGPAPVVPAAVPATPIPVSAPPATPKPKGPPTAWEQLQAKPIGEGIDIPVATPFPADSN